MSLFHVAVHVVPRRGLLDPQGAAVVGALHSLGFAGVQDVRVGRHLVIHTEATSATAAAASVRRMCEQLLANPVTEDFEIETLPAAQVGVPS